MEVGDTETININILKKNMPVNATNDNFGWLAHDYNLLDVSGKKLSLNEILGSNGTVIAFICKKMK